MTAGLGGLGSEKMCEDGRHVPNLLRDCPGSKNGPLSGG